MTISPKTKKAYEKWVKAAEQGYSCFGGTREITHYAALRRVDERIRRLKAEYETLLQLDKEKAELTVTITPKGRAAAAHLEQLEREAERGKVGRCPSDRRWD